MINKFRLIVVLLMLTAVSGWAQDKKKANTWFSEQNYEQALEEYLSLLEDEPNNMEYNYRLGVCYLNTNIDKAKAVPYFEKVANDPKANANTLYLLGRSYHFAYRFDEAIETYNKFRKQGTGSPDNLKDVDFQIEYCQNAKELMKFPVKVEFENLGDAVNGPYPDYFPFVPVDESFLVFNTRRDDGSEENIDGSHTSNIYIAKVKNGTFTEAKSVGDVINTDEGNEEIIGLSNDGSKALLYFDDNRNYGEIYIGAVQDGKFDKPAVLDKVINSRYVEIAASFTEDGNAIYFASDRPGGYGGVDLYVSRILPNGQWGPAQNLGPSVNTADDEDFPNIAPDGTTLYFSSKGHTSMGGYDIFKATYDEAKKKWGGVRNIGFPINTPEDNMNFRVSKTGRYGYISALRKGGYGDLDIYRVTFKEVDTRYTVIKGVVSSADTTQQVGDVFISVMDLETQEIYGDYLPNPESMRYIIILPPGKFNVFIEADGFEEVSEDIEVYDKSSYRAEVKKDIVLKPLD